MESQQAEGVSRSIPLLDGWLTRAADEREMMDCAVSNIGRNRKARNALDDDSEELIVELAFREDV